MDEQAGFEGLKECLWPIARQHGRELVIFAISVQLARQAAAELAQQQQKHVSKRGAGALNILASEYSNIAEGLMGAKGWTEELLAEVTQSCEIALSGDVPRIQLIN